MATSGLALLAGCLDGPSSGGPSYETHEIDDGPVFSAGLQDETERGYYAALITGPGEAEEFDWDRAPEAAREFVENTDFTESYLGLIQVGELNSSMRFEVVDLTESDVNLTVVVAVRDETPHSDDLVITTFLVRVASDGSDAPEQISVELTIGDHHETFTGG